MQLRSEIDGLAVSETTAIALLICHSSTTFFRDSGNDGQKYKPVLCKQQTPCRYFRRVQYFRRFSWWENSIKKKPFRKVLSREQPRHCSYAALECSEWLPSVSMDGLDISEESNIKVPSRLQLALLLHLQQIWRAVQTICLSLLHPSCTTTHCIWASTSTLTTCRCYKR